MSRRVGRVTRLPREAERSAMIVRKSAFARLRNVTPGRVTQWIASGRISRAALVGEGRSARINVALATADVVANRDKRMASRTAPDQLAMFEPGGCAQ